MSKVPKRQKGVDAFNGVGANYLPGKDSHIILFFDNEDWVNIGLDESPRPFNFYVKTKGMFIAVKIDDKTRESGRLLTEFAKEDNDFEIKKFGRLRTFSVMENIFMSEFLSGKDKKDIMMKFEVQE